jgi:hypothetical protein
MAAETVLSEGSRMGKGWGLRGVRGRPMWASGLSRNLALMHPTLMSTLANERSCDLRAEAASRRRGRLALLRSRRASARRLRRGVRVAHA